jgi:hypothetical protein
MGIASGTLAGTIRQWPHNLYIVRPGSGEGGGYNEDDEWVEDEEDIPEVVYNGGADVQDTGRTIQRTDEGLPSVRSDAVAFLRDEKAVADVKVGDPVMIRWEDGTFADATVIRVSRFDGSLDLTRV